MHENVEIIPRNRFGGQVLLTEDFRRSVGNRKDIISTTESKHEIHEHKSISIM